MTEYLGDNLARTILGSKYDNTCYYTMQTTSTGFTICVYKKETKAFVEKIELEDTFSEDEAKHVYETTDFTVKKNWTSTICVIILLLCVVGVAVILKNLFMG